MRKSIIITLIIIILLIFVALVLDWGRRSEDMPVENNSMQDFGITSTSTIDGPIIVENIKDNQTVSSPIAISGRAKGNWYFEASFPIQLIDAEGNVIALTIAQAEGDWMTNDYVKFNAMLEFTKPTSTGRALLIFKKDNPSGNPEFDQSIFIPVILK